MNDNKILHYMTQAVEMTRTAGERLPMTT